MSEEINEAIVRVLDVIPSPEDSRDWSAEALLANPYPDTYDMRPFGQAIRNQGSQGACAAMAGAAMKEVQEYKDCNISAYFSPQFIYNLRENKPSEGMYMRDLMKILKNNGDCLETTYPYLSTGAITSSISTEASRYRVQGYASITTIGGLKQALFANGPAVIAVPVYNYGTPENQYRIWSQGAGQQFLGGHAMAVYGYNATGFIIRNSWGNTWGNAGYTTFPYSDWGKQWECWTTIDIKTGPVKPAPKKVSILTVISRTIRRFLWRNTNGNRFVKAKPTIPPVKKY